MKFKKYKSQCNGLDFVIEQDLPDIGYVLYVYKDGKCQSDSLQDTLEICMKRANRLYGVPLESWVEEKKEES